MKIVVFMIILGVGGLAMQKKPLALDGTWMFKVDSLNKGIPERWYDTHCDRSNWLEVDVPNYWERYHGMAMYDGAGWFARTIEMKDISQPLSIFFSGVDDDADVWINGLKVGSHAGYSDSFSLPIDQAVKVGSNEIVIRVNDNTGPGGIYKPVTIVPTNKLDQLLRTKYAAMVAKKSPEWVKDAVIYEVYLRSFSKEGTFKALETKIPELKKLGVSVVWLMPIHPTGKVNRKGSLGSPYSIQDYYAVNPEFGTLNDFKSLVNAVHQNGLKILIDLVANHTAWDNPILKEHPDWYTHDASGKIIPPNPDWTDVADLNYDQLELRSYMITMMKYWVRDIGIDGYRCDVAELVPTDFWETARKELDAIKPIVMLSEGTMPEHHIKAFDLTYSWNVYDVLSKVLNGSTPATIFHDLLKTESYQFPQGSLRMRFNTNHDKNAYDGPAVEIFTPQGAKSTAVLVFTYPGVPLIYNGEEVGNDKKLGLFEKEDIDWSKNAEFRTLYEKLSLLRKQHPALVEGSYSPIQNSESNKVYSFIRSKADDSVIVAINFNSSPVLINLTLPSNSETVWKDHFTGTIYEAANNQYPVVLPSLGFVVLSPSLRAK
jgi:cyclomaltodextrinase / maltogenic alpha-amylase / neopullulanase